MMKYVLATMALIQFSEAINLLESPPEDLAWRKEGAEILSELFFKEAHKYGTINGTPKDPERLYRVEMDAYLHCSL